MNEYSLAKVQSSIIDVSGGARGNGHKRFVHRP